MKTLYAWIGGKEISFSKIWNVEDLAKEQGVPIIDVKRMILKDHSDYWVEFREEDIDPHFSQPMYRPLKHGFYRDKNGIVEVWQVSPTFVVWQVVVDENGNWIKGSNPHRDYKIKWMDPDESFFVKDFGVIRLNELVCISFSEAVKNAILFLQRLL